MRVLDVANTSLWYSERQYLINFAIYGINLTLITEKRLYKGPVASEVSCFNLTQTSPKPHSTFINFYECLRYIGINTIQVVQQKNSYNFNTEVIAVGVV